MVRAPSPVEGEAAPRDDPSELAELARRCGHLASRAAEAGRALSRDSARLGQGWQGTAAAAAAGELVAAARLVDRLPGLLSAAAAVLRDYAGAVEQATDELARLDARRVHTLVRQPPGTDAELAVLQARRAQTMARLGDQAVLAGRRLLAVADAVVPARRTATGRSVGPAAREPALVGLLPMLAAQRARSVTGGGAGAVPLAGTPAVLVRSWWSWLTSDEQARLLRTRPRQVGRLAGLPAAALDAANERLLARYLADPGDRSVTDDVRRRRQAALVVAGAMARARSAGDPVTGAPVVVRLLGFSPGAFGGRGRALVAVGDPDTADNVAFVVPGMGTDVVHGLPGLVEDAARVRGTARRVAPRESTATVAWLGYAAPGYTTVASSTPATVGGARLSGDLLATASRPVAPHLTVIGHSYGSTVVGVALRAGPVGVDDAVLLGSPGAGVGRAAQLHVPAGHVFVGASSRDPVSYLDRFGLDPSHQRFAAVRFQAEDPTRNPGRLDFADHTKYLRAGSESLANSARVVAGEGEQVTRAPYRHELPWRPDGISADPEARRRPTRVDP